MLLEQQSYDCVVGIDQMNEMTAQYDWQTKIHDREADFPKAVE